MKDFRQLKKGLFVVLFLGFRWIFSVKCFLDRVYIFKCCIGVVLLYDMLSVRVMWDTSKVDRNSVSFLP